MLRKITDDSFNIAWADVNNRRILARVCRKFKGALSHDELRYRSYMALLRCMQCYDPGRKTKFTTSLYRHVVWQCSKAMRERKRQGTYYPLPEVIRSYPDMTAIYVRDCIDSLPDEHGSILVSYFFLGMTLREIGHANGYSHVDAHRRLSRAKEAFRLLYGE